MRSRTVPRSDPCNHSRALCQTRVLRSSTPNFASFSAEKHNSSSLAWRQEKVSSLSPLTGSAVQGASKIPKDNPTVLKAAQSQTLDHQKPVVIHVLLWVSFNIHDLTVFFHHLHFPRKGNWEGNSSTTSPPPPSLYLWLWTWKDTALFWTMS